MERARRARDGMVDFVDGGGLLHMCRRAGGGEEGDGTGYDGDEGVEPLAPTGGSGGFFVGGGGDAGGSGVEVRFNL